MSTPVQHVEATLEALVEYLFLNNKNDSKVFLNIPYGDDGVRNNHDLFMFFVDMLIKGLVLLYGNEERKVPLDNLTREQLEYVQQKMKNAGVELKVNIAPVVIPPESEAPPQPLNLRPCIIKGETDELMDYKLRVVSNNIEYTIQFELNRLNYS